MKNPTLIIASVSISLLVLSATYLWLSPKEENKNEAIPEKTEDLENNNEIDVEHNETQPKVKKVEKPKILLYYKNACSILDIFTKKPILPCKTQYPERSDNTLAVVGISIFLVVLALNGVYDTLKENEKDKLKLKQDASGERRPSLAEFANKNTMRRESSKIGLQLSQILETPDKTNQSEDHKDHRTRTESRSDSPNMFRGEQKGDVANSPKKHPDVSPGESILVKRLSASKILGM